MNEIDLSEIILSVVLNDAVMARKFLERCQEKGTVFSKMIDSLSDKECITVANGLVDQIKLMENVQ